MLVPGGMGLMSLTGTAPKKSPGDPVPAQANANAVAPSTSGNPAPNTPYVPLGNPHSNPSSTGNSSNSASMGNPHGGFKVFTGPAKFPSDLDSLQPTWMEIWSHKRTGVGIGSKHAEADFIPEAVGATSNICLPIPSGVGAGYGHSWDQSDVSMADEFALGAGGLGNLISKGANMFIDVSSKAVGPGGSRSESTATAKGSSDSSGVLAGFVSGMSTNAIGTIGLKTAGDVLGGGVQQATGKAAFNEQVVHYSGPQFRTFEFSFSLKPMSPADQDSINRIVSFLKVGSAPELLDSGGIGRVYQLPLFFKIKFMSRSGENEHMNKIGFCALTGFNVKYGGDRFQTFSANDAPVQTDISMSFKEISLLNQASVRQGY